MKIGLNKQSGYTLVEVLAAFTILSIVSLGITSFFTSSMSYTKGNQDKTVMVNLARNALFYMEKLDFEEVESYFNTSVDKSIKCDIGAECPQAIKDLVDDPTVLQQVLNPVVNGVQYSVVIHYQDRIRVNLLPSKVANYLIPVNVEVYKTGKDRSSKRNSSRVEGYITDAKIR